MVKTKIKASTKRGKFKLQLRVNDEVFKCQTDDLKASMLKFAPDVVKTRVRIRIEKDGRVCERQYNILKGRMLFKRKMMLDIFVRKLVFIRP